MEIMDERVTRVWNYGMQIYGGNEELVRKHLARWIAAVTPTPRGTATVDRDVEIVDVVKCGGQVVGVVAHV